MKKLAYETPEFELALAEEDITTIDDSLQDGFQEDESFFFPEI